MKAAWLGLVFVISGNAWSSDFYNRGYMLADETVCCFDSQYAAKSRLADAFYRAAHALCEDEGGTIATDYASRDLIQINELLSKNDDNQWVAGGSASVQCRFPRTKTVGGIRG